MSNMTLPQGAGGKGNVLGTHCVLLLSAPAVNTNGELPIVTCLGAQSTLVIFRNRIDILVVNRK